MAAAGWALTPAIVGCIRTPAPAVELTITHLRYTCLAMPSVFTYLVMMMVMRGAGDSKTPFKFTLVWIGGSMLLGPGRKTKGKPWFQALARPPRLRIIIDIQHTE